jgi:hypothetical protein
MCIYIYILNKDILTVKFQRSNPMSKCTHHIVGFTLDEDKYPYKWTLNVLQDNGIMVDIWFLMESKDNL